MKLLYKPTGNIFTLPDEEVTRILKADRGNDYEVVGAECEATEETDQADDQVEEETEEETEEEVETEESEEVKSRLKQFEIAEDYNNLTKKELAVIAERVTGRYVDPTKLNKADIINLIEGKNE
jgi:NAD/NADP transhydrogenase alpha subunit